MAVLIACLMSHPLGAATCFTSPPLADPIPGRIGVGTATVRLEPLADELVVPHHATFGPGHPDHLVVIDLVGQAWTIEIDTGARTLLLDVSDRLVTLGIQGPGTFDERGLLGIAFHPLYPQTGKLYTYTSEPALGLADFPGTDGIVNHQSVIAEWQVLDPGSATTSVNTATRRELLRIDQPQFNHNGGALNFGPDGMLYIALGDGGGADDSGAGHGSGNGQDTSNVLGSVLRIDVDGDDSDNGQYGIPPDNPLLADAAAVPEIYAYGLRNPFRFSFDPEGGALYLGDVGQNDIEEVNLIVAGGNYGWNRREGSFCFDDNGAGDGFVAEPDPGVTGLIDPLAEYDQDEGRSVIGGHVNRGEQAQQTAGRYLFGDYLGRLFYLDDGSAIAEVKLENRPGGFGERILGFGEGANADLFLLSNQHGRTSGQTGNVYAIRSAITRGTEEELMQLAYLAFFGRPADPEGLAFWVTRLILAEGDLSELIEDFGNAEEFVERFGGLSDTDLVDNIFLQLFTRAADPVGLQFYLDLLTGGSHSLQTIALDVLNGARRKDTEILGNKLRAAERFTELVQTTGYDYGGSEVADRAKELFDQIGSDPEAGFALVDDFFAP